MRWMNGPRLYGTFFSLSTTQPFTHSHTQSGTRQRFLSRVPHDITMHAHT